MWMLADAARTCREARRARTTPDDFDREYGVRTRVVPRIRDTWRTFLRGGVVHEPSSPAAFHEVLDSLHVACRETAFVDIGSGAGRVVLMAAGYPFRSVLGIEISPELHMMAERNVQALPGDKRLAADIKLVCADATTHPLPPEPLLLYLYNPFGVAPMRRFRTSLETALLAGRHHPITVVLAYCYRDTREVLEGSPLLRVVRSQGGVAVLQSRAHAEPN
jgi:predicted RNA methylase